MAFTDTFNRASLGAAWETVEGTAWTIASSLYLKPAGAYQQTGVRLVGTCPTDHYAEVWTEVPSAAGDASLHGPAVRMGATGDCYYVRLFLTSVVLYKHVAGADTYLTEGAITLAADMLVKLKLVVLGAALEVFASDVSRCTFTEGGLSTGKPGCHALTGQTSTFPRFDDFAASDLVGGSPIGVLVSAQQARRRRSAR